MVNKDYNFVSDSEEKRLVETRFTLRHRIHQSQFSFRKCLNEGSSKCLYKPQGLMIKIVYYFTQYTQLSTQREPPARVREPKRDKKCNYSFIVTI